LKLCVVICNSKWGMSGRYGAGAIKNVKNIKKMGGAFAVLAVMSAGMCDSPAWAASVSSLTHCRLTDVSLRLSGCTLIIEDPTESAANRVIARINRGSAFKAKGAYDRALDDYDEALKLDPANAQALNERGVIWLLKGNFDHAINDLTDAIRLNANSADTFYNRGCAYLQRVDARSALADFDQAIKLSSNTQIASTSAASITKFSSGDANADYFAGRGHAYTHLGKYQEAAADYAKARSLRPDDPYATLWLYTARARSGGVGAIGQIQNVSAVTQKTGWPYPLLRLFVDSSATPNSVLAVASSPSQRCQAEFYVAQWRLARFEQQTEGLAALRTIATTCPKELVEHKMALAELRRLRP
jgi:tetratricopeptide (TPR) repeat protein